MTISISYSRASGVYFSVVPIKVIYQNKIKNASLKRRENTFYRISEVELLFVIIDCSVFLSSIK